MTTRETVSWRKKNSLEEKLSSKGRLRRERLRRSGLDGAVSRNDLSPQIELETLSIELIRLPPRNVRTVTEAHVDEVARSIMHFGYCAPVIIGKNNMLIDGFVRLEAAKRAGLTALPCIRIDHLSASEQRQLRLALNRLAEKGEWNLDELKLELFELIEFDELPFTGFDTDETDLVLLTDDATALEKGELEPAINAIATAQVGDLFMLGSHRVICGNATDRAVIERLMSGLDEARLVLTDEPYNVPIRGHVTGGAHREFAMASGEMTDEGFAAFNTAWMAAASASLCDGGVLGTFIDWRGLPTVHAAATGLSLTPLNLVVWSKTNAGMGSLYRSQHELLPLFRKGDQPIVNNVNLGRKGRSRSNVWVYPGASSLGSDARKGLKDHPTVKPTALLEDALLDITNRGDVVLDPFLGSGSTLIAAARCERLCCGVELDPLYVDVICRRYQAVTGRSAIHEATGMTFEALATHRAAPAIEPTGALPSVG